MCSGKKCQVSRVEEQEKTFSAPTLHSWLVGILTCELVWLLLAHRMTSMLLRAHFKSRSDGTNPRVCPVARVFLQSRDSNTHLRTGTLECENGRLRCGSFPIDLVYKRVIINELLAACIDSHPLIRAYRAGDVCLVNSFRCKLVHKKAVFELQTDEANAGWFTCERRFSQSSARAVGPCSRCTLIRTRLYLKDASRERWSAYQIRRWSTSSGGGETGFFVIEGEAHSGAQLMGR